MTRKRGPVRARTAFTTSSGSFTRPSKLPPNSSVRVLVNGAVNWLSR